MSKKSNTLYGRAMPPTKQNCKKLHQLFCQKNSSLISRSLGSFPTSHRIQKISRMLIKKVPCMTRAENFHFNDAIPSITKRPIVTRSPRIRTLRGRTPSFAKLLVARSHLMMGKTKAMTNRLKRSKRSTLFTVWASAKKIFLSLDPKYL